MTNQSTTILRPFHALEVLTRAKQLEAAGRKVFHLQVGEPAAPAAPKAIEAVAATLHLPQGYTHSKGMLELRRSLSGYYDQQHQVGIDPENIIVTSGSSAGFVLTFLTCFERGARIAVTRPGYPAYINILAGLGFEIAEIAVNAHNRWALTAADIEAAHAVQPFDGLLFASPANPTGSVVQASELKEIIEVCERLGVQLISDEIYHGLDYSGRSVSASEFSDKVILVNSFSKYYCMTGWRVGWLVLPEHLVRKAEMLQQSMFISAPKPSQTVANAALGERAYADAQKQRYADNRLLLGEGLRTLGFEGQVGDGAFYAYMNASSITNDSMRFCAELLEETGVATTPGIDFDRVNGDRFVRFSYAGSREDMEEALNRIEGFVSTR